MRSHFKNENLISEAKETESLDGKHEDLNSMLRDHSRGRKARQREGSADNKTHALSEDPYCWLTTACILAAGDLTPSGHSHTYFKITLKKLI